MEYAIRIISPTEEELVSITQMQKLGEDEARDYDYKCPDEDCRVKVYPSFPQTSKPGRIKAPRPYFSARDESHEESCRRDTMIVLDKKVRSRRPTRTLTPKAEALLDCYPMRLDESEHESERKGGGGTSKGGDTTSDGSPAPPGTGGGGVRGSGESSERTRVSVRSSRHVSEFVRVYEALPEECSRLPIKIKGCPAKTYVQAFLHVSEAVDAQGRIGPRHIYWGEYERFKQSESGTSIYLKAPRATGFRSACG